MKKLAPLLERAILSARHGAVLFDAVGEAVLANAVARCLLDAESASLGQLGKTVASELPLDRVLAAGERFEALEVERRVRGQPGVLRADLDPVHDEAGAVVGAIVWLEDITEVRRVERELRRAEKRFEDHIERSLEMIALHRPDEGILYVNPAGMRLLGYEDFGALRGRPAVELVHPDDRPLVAQRIREMSEQGLSVPVIEERLLRSDGGFALTQVAAFPIVYRGKPTIMVIGMDLSERRRLLEEARQRAAELESVLENMVDVVLVWDAQGRLRHSNHAGRTLLGGGGPIVGLSNDELAARLSPSRLDGHALAFEELPGPRALSGETVKQAAMVCKPAAGAPLYVQVSAVPLRGAGGEVIGAVEVLRDVTELTELDRLKDEFIRVTAHELKTPVTVVKGYAQAALRMVAGLPPEAVRLLEGIDRGADRIARIVRDLVDVSALHFGRLHLRPQQVELGPLVREAVARAAARAPKLQVELARCEEVAVLADRERLVQVLDNLLDNALLFSREGGPVEVELRREEGSAVIAVRDYGPGIPPEKQPRIFERFYRAHTGTPYDYGGMGVGLYISHEIARRLGGTLTFESRPGQTTFTLRLPLARL